MTDQLLEAVREFFKQRGYVEAPRPRGATQAASFFEGGGVRAAVFTVGEDALRGRGEALRSILAASTFREGVDYVYVAVPKVLATVIDSSVLSEQGLGLLVVDGRVVEALPARRRAPQPGLAELERRVAELEAQLSKLAKLKVEGLSQAELSRLDLIEARLAELRAKLDSAVKRLEASIASLAERLTRLEEVRERVEAVVEAAVEEAGRAMEAEGLPSYFKDNPWLSILASRGKER